MKFQLNRTLNSIVKICTKPECVLSDVSWSNQNYTFVMHTFLSIQTTQRRFSTYLYNTSFLTKGSCAFMLMYGVFVLYITKVQKNHSHGAPFVSKLLKYIFLPPALGLSYLGRYSSRTRNLLVSFLPDLYR